LLDRSRAIEFITKKFNEQLRYQTFGKNLKKIDVGVFEALDTEADIMRQSREKGMNGGERARASGYFLTEDAISWLLHS